MPAVARGTRSSKRPAPIHGVARLLFDNRSVGGLCAVAINSTTYWLSELVGDDGKAGGYRLTRDDTGDVYEIWCQWKWSCDCKDALYRRPEGGCKHCKSLQALQAAGKI